MRAPTAASVLMAAALAATAVSGGALADHMDDEGDTIQVDVVNEPSETEPHTGCTDAAPVGGGHTVLLPVVYSGLCEGLGPRGEFLITVVDEAGQPAPFAWDVGFEPYFSCGPVRDAVGQVTINTTRGSTNCFQLYVDLQEPTLEGQITVERLDVHPRD